MTTMIERIKASAAAAESKWHAQLACSFLGDAFASIAMHADNAAHTAAREAAYAAAFAAEYADEIAAMRARVAIAAPATVVIRKVA